MGNRKGENEATEGATPTSTNAQLSLGLRHRGPLGLWIWVSAPMYCQSRPHILAYPTAASIVRFGSNRQQIKELQTCSSATVCVSAQW